MQPAGLSGLPTTHSRMLVTGAFFAALGGLLGLIGAMLGGVAITKTLREWAASENSQLLVAKARAAATAAATHGASAWRADVPQQATRRSGTLTGT